MSKDRSTVLGLVGTCLIILLLLLHLFIPESKNNDIYIQKALIEFNRKLIEINITLDSINKSIDWLKPLPNGDTLFESYDSTKFRVKKWKWLEDPYILDHSEIKKPKKKSYTTWKSVLPLTFTNGLSRNTNDDSGMLSSKKEAALYNQKPKDWVRIDSERYFHKFLFDSFRDDTEYLRYLTTSDTAQLLKMLNMPIDFFKPRIRRN